MIGLNVKDEKGKEKDNQ